MSKAKAFCALGKSCFPSSLAVLAIASKSLRCNASHIGDRSTNNTCNGWLSQAAWLGEVLGITHTTQHLQEMAFPGRRQQHDRI